MKIALFVSSQSLQSIHTSITTAFALGEREVPVPYVLLPVSVAKYSAGSMEQVNLLCETENCEETAKVFGLNGTLKIKSCEKHFSSLLSKTTQFFDISGYSFISSLQDAAAFEERKIQKDKGRGNLTVLEANCELELIEALEAIEKVKSHVMSSVESRFEEMKAAVTMTCAETKKQLFLLQTEVEQSLTSKDNRLSPTAELLCKDMSVIPMFLRFGIADAADRVSSVLSESWDICTADIHSTLTCLDATQKTAAIENALAEASEYAKKGIPETLRYANRLIGDETPFDERIDKVLSELLIVEKKRIEENLKWLQRSWDLRQRYSLPDKATVEVGQKLASILYRQFAQLSEVENILRHCYDVARQSLPEICISLCCDICEVYYAISQSEKAEEFGMWALETFGTTNYSAEYCWIILVHLFYSRILQSRKNEAIALVEDWRKRNLGEESNFAQMVSLFACGSGLYYSGNNIEAEKLLLQARTIGINYFPTSVFTASAISRLSTACQKSTKEQFFQQAQSIFEATSPKSVYSAINLHNLGFLLNEANRWKEAEECYRQALSIFELMNPKSLHIPITLNCLGALLKGTQQWSEAEKCYKQEQSIFEDAAPNTLGAASNFSSLGVLFMEINRIEEAEECHRQAESIYRITSPNSIEAAFNLHNLGILFNGRRKWKEAEECYRQAQSVYEFVSPNSTHTANVFNSLGVMLKEIYRFEEAENCHRQADSIYEITAPKTMGAGTNLHNLGVLLESRRRWREAEECYRKAKAIYEITASISCNEAITLRCLGGLLKGGRRWGEAEECYRQAQSIYDSVAPNSIGQAYNLCDLGVLLRGGKRWKDSEECHRQALSIFEVIAPKSVQAGHNLFNMGLLFKAMKQIGRAIECFEKAALIFAEAGEADWKFDAERNVVNLKKQNK